MRRRLQKKAVRSDSLPTESYCRDPLGGPDDNNSLSREPVRRRQEKSLLVFRRSNRKRHSRSLSLSTPQAGKTRIDCKENRRRSGESERRTRRAGRKVIPKREVASGMLIRKAEPASWKKKRSARSLSMSCSRKFEAQGTDLGEQGKEKARRKKYEFLPKSSITMF